MKRVPNVFYIERILRRPLLFSDNRLDEKFSGYSCKASKIPDEATYVQSTEKIPTKNFINFQKCLRLCISFICGPITSILGTVVLRDKTSPKQ